MQCLGPACQILIGYLAKQVGNGQRSVLHFGLGCTTDILTQADNFIIIRHLPAHGQYARILLCGLQTGIEQKHVSACFYLPAAVDYPAAVVLQGIEAAEIPRHAYTCHIVCTEFIFQHIQPRIAVGTLQKSPKRGITLAFSVASCTLSCSV